MADKMKALPQPPGPPPRDRLRELKQLLTDRFWHYRLGIGEFLGYDDAARRPVRARIPIPPEPGRWPGHPAAPLVTQTLATVRARGDEGLGLIGQGGHGQGQGQGRRGRRRRALGRLFLPGRRRQGPVSGAEDQEQGQGQGQGQRQDSRAEKAARRRAAMDAMAVQLGRDFAPAGYRFRRVLGFGGFGAALLFEMTGRDGAVVPVVVKAEFSGGVARLKGVRREKENFVVSFSFLFVI